jgi:hypothetical protein
MIGIVPSFFAYKTTLWPRRKYKKVIRIWLRKYKKIIRIWLELSLCYLRIIPHSWIRRNTRKLSPKIGIVPPFFAYKTNLWPRRKYKKVIRIWLRKYKKIIRIWLELSLCYLRIRPHSWPRRKYNSRELIDNMKWIWLDMKDFYLCNRSGIVII